MADDRTYAMLVKPVSSKCNLRCEYCYYLGKDDTLCQLNEKMPPEVLQQYTRQLIEMHGKDAVVEFAWHGGEPTAAGLAFFREAVELQRRFGQGRKILNTIQTNATLLNDEWCDFLKEHCFEVGVSIDGPEKLHNAYRKKSNGEGSFSDTMRGIELLKKHGIPITTLTAVNRENMRQPLAVYDFLKELTDHMQFLPVVERGKNAGEMAPFSVTPESFGSFLCAIWDRWYGEDRGKKHIQYFDVAIGCLYGIPSSLCVLSPVCGHSGSVEANGDVYSCDRFAFPQYKLGNLMETPLRLLMEKNYAFGMNKTYGLAQECFDCPYVKLCFGGCPKDRLWGNQNYLCKGYQMFFAHIMKNG